MRWLEEAVEDENSYAEYLLGKTYLKGEDVEQDLLYAEDLLRLSVKHGNKYAKYALGKALLDGEYITQNIPEGLELLKESAGAGFSAAQYLYGKLLYKGELLPKDIDRAVAYIEMPPNRITHTHHTLPERYDSPKTWCEMSEKQYDILKLPPKAEIIMPNINSEKSICTARMCLVITTKVWSIYEHPRNMETNTQSSSSIALKVIAIGLRRWVLLDCFII